MSLPRLALRHPWTIVVAIVAPIAGPAAIYGNEAGAGAQAFFNQLNIRGGINGAQVRLVQRDDQYKPALTVQQVKDLLESELFGHERGAFTGAQTMRRGRFEQADGGTLFLDEIGDMPFELQTRLLRVLSDGHFYRVGGHSAVKTNVRVIAATNSDLTDLIANGAFRSDLYFRLNVVPFELPNLAERSEDIELLVAHFFKLFFIHCQIFF